MDDGSEAWPLLTRLVREFAAAQPELPSRMADAIRDGLEFYRSGTVSRAEIEESARAHVTALADPDDEARRGAPPRELGERRARDGVALSDVMDALRAGTSFLWNEIVRAARERGVVSDAELVELATEMWLMHDDYVRTMAAAYRGEQARVLLSRQQERLGVVYGLLTARGKEAASPWEALDRLGLPRTGGFVVVAASATAEGRLPLPRIEQSLVESDVASAWVMVASVLIGIVSTEQAQWRATLVAGARPWPATAGVSPRFDDFGRLGFATRLARTALAAAPVGTMRFFEQDPVAMSAAGSPDVSREVLDAVLGPLLALPSPERDTILDTVDAWYRSAGAVSDVAAELGVHQNTVRNRLRRLASLTGRDVARPRDAAELYLALAAHRQA